MIGPRWWGLSWLVAIGISLCAETWAQDAPVPDPPEYLDGWGWAVDPDGTSTFRADESKLTIVTPGPAQDLSIELGRMNAPRTARKVQGDFVAQVKVSGQFAPGEMQGIPVRLPYHGAGLLLMGDFQNYVRIDRAAVVKGTSTQHYVALQTWDRGETIPPIGPWSATLEKATDVYLRLERRGDVILGAIALEPGKWHYLAPQRASLPNAVWIGVAAINASGQKIEPQFEQFEVLQPTEASKPEQDPQPKDLPPGADGAEPPQPSTGQRIASVDWPAK